jgi:hypothetical protein
MFFEFSLVWLILMITPKLAAEDACEDPPHQGKNSKE